MSEKKKHSSGLRGSTLEGTGCQMIWNPSCKTLVYHWTFESLGFFLMCKSQVMVLLYFNDQITWSMWKFAICKSHCKSIVCDSVLSFHFSLDIFSRNMIFYQIFLKDFSWYYIRSAFDGRVLLNDISQAIWYFQTRGRKIFL